MTKAIDVETSSDQRTTAYRSIAAHTFKTTVLERQIAAIVEIVASLDRGDGAQGDALLRAFDELVRTFDGFQRNLDEDGDHATSLLFGQRVQAALMPLLRRADNGHRWYAKPRGYAGDYLSIARMYDDEPRGTGRVDQLIDRCFLRLPAVLAVQNRRALVRNEIRASLRRVHDEGIRITSFACGPARELFDLYAHLDDPRAVEATLIDFDTEALAYCHQRARSLGVDDVVTLVEANLIHAAVGRIVLDLPAQDFIYSIGLIDYFADDLVIKLMNLAHMMLRPGGRILLGNFHPRNPTRAVMDHILEWKLIHRTEEDMHRLYQASNFGRGCTRITYEPQQINLFAECVRERA